MRLATGLPAGVSALLFDSAARLRALEGRLAGALDAAGFREAILPVVDYFAPYEPLLPPAARAELYRFADRDGELLALRSDFTPLLARLLAPHLAGLDLPLRLFYRGDVVRCPERGARRETEVYQIGGELLGAPADAEALEREAVLLCARLLALAAPGRARLVLGLAGVLDELLVAAAGAGAPGLARAVARRELAAARGAGAALAEIVERGTPADAAALGARGGGRPRAPAADRGGGGGGAHPASRCRSTSPSSPTSRRSPSRRGRATCAPTTRARSSAPTCPAWRARWRGAGATTASSGRSARRPRRSASRCSSTRSPAPPRRGSAR